MPPRKAAPTLTPTATSSQRRTRTEKPGAPQGKGGRDRRGSTVELSAIKLQKALADAGHGSRREIESWIAEGRVNVNDEPAHIGQRVTTADKVKLNGRLVYLKNVERLPRVLIYHKPEGEIVSRDDPEGRPSVFEKLPRIRGSRWIAVGRLDFNSCGLLLVTDSGELANRLMHPRYELEREYAVRVMGEVSQESLYLLQAGIELEDGLARFIRISPAGGEGANHWYRVVLNEGKNREIRRMFEAVGVMVSRLMRVRYGPVGLPPQLKRGQHRQLEDAEVKALMKILQPAETMDKSSA
ncbi:MAG: pseudouridine synthase [Georgfuchsia sp.]